MWWKLEENKHTAESVLSFGNGYVAREIVSVYLQAESRVAYNFSGAGKLGHFTTQAHVFLVPQWHSIHDGLGFPLDSPLHNESIVLWKWNVEVCTAQDTWIEGMNDKLSNNAHSVRQMYLHGNTHLRYLGLLACDCQSYRVRKFERRFYSYRVTLYSVPERKKKWKKYVQSSTYSWKGWILIQDNR